jgi:hypothetical protein
MAISCEKPSTAAERAVLRDRVEKDLMFATSKGPLDSLERLSFHGLKYFDYNNDFNVLADFTVYAKQDTIEMPTTRGLKKYYLRYGEAKFVINETTHQLNVLKMINSQYTDFFIPFTDISTGEETYSTGRYLEIDEFHSDTFRIDFNRAYNPWCNYSDNYNCPIPVSFNRLKIVVDAGEKTYPRGIH